MIEDHLKELRALVDQADDLPEETRAKLLQHVANIEGESAKASAASGVSEEVAATPEEQEEVSGLISTVEGLEASHPQITALINRLAVVLGNMGI